MRKIFIKPLLLIIAPSVLLLLIAITFYLFFPHSPALDRTHKYRKEYAFTSYFPFVMPYYLMYPAEYDSEKDYPLVLALHGGFGKNYGAYQLALLDKRAAYPAFVLIPFAPPLMLWANPDNSVVPFYRLHVLDAAMDILYDQVDTLSIDENRIYVTGSSNGGRGTFGALKAYPDIFAAGVAVNSDWAPHEYKHFEDKPLWIFLGAEDPIFSAENNREFMRRIGDDGVTKYTEYPGVGHKAWKHAYTDDSMWDWLFSQTLKQESLEIAPITTNIPNVVLEKTGE